MTWHDSCMDFDGGRGVAYEEIFVGASDAHKKGNKGLN